MAKKTKQIETAADCGSTAPSIELTDVNVEFADTTTNEHSTVPMDKPADENVNPGTCIAGTPGKPAVHEHRPKRIRIRKKTTKHLSVAILCSNPQIKRFI